MPPHYRWWRFMSPKRINSAFFISNKLIANIIFFICVTLATLGLYTLIIYTGLLYVWIFTNAISRFIICYDYEAKLISLLIIKHTYIAAFRLYRSWNP